MDTKPKRLQPFQVKLVKVGFVGKAHPTLRLQRHEMATSKQTPSRQTSRTLIYERNVAPGRPYRPAMDGINPLTWPGPTDLHWLDVS